MSENIFKHAKWICTKDFSDEKPINLFHKQLDKKKPELPEHLKNIHMLTRKKLHVNKKVGSKYKIRITADDYYKLYINGRFVCQGPAQSSSTKKRDFSPIRRKAHIRRSTQTLSPRSTAFLCPKAARL